MTAPSQPEASTPAYAPSACLDPYLRWAECTEWRSLRQLAGQGLGTGGEPILTLRVLVQAPTALSEEDLLRLLKDSRWTVADVYKQPIPGGTKRARHFTASVERKDLPWLKSNPADIRWELALPFRDAETTARAVQVGGTGPTRDASSYRMKPIQGFDVASDPVARCDIDSAIAVIDFGCPFLNTAFAGADEDTTRVVALWDQGSETPEDGCATPWHCAKERMGYGRELSQGVMNTLLKSLRAGHPVVMDETEVYRRIDYLIDYDDERRRIWGATHGSHVLGVAGGGIDPLTGQADQHASKAPLIFVQLPSLTGADSSGGSLSAQVLDAVRYVLDVCKDNARVVINLSYGSSLVEQALDEVLAARKDSVALVLGAGNARQAACHVRRSARKNRSALLSVDLPAGDFTDTFVEVWFDDTPHLHLLKARVRSGDGDWSSAVGPGAQTELRAANDTRPAALLRMDRSVPNGRKPLLLLALAPTARPADDDGPLAGAGVWEIELFLDPGCPEVKAMKDDVEVAFDAWVERDDPGWLGGGWQARFTDPHFGDADQTLSSLATGKHTIAVGGFRLDDGLPAAYSSIGKRDGPPVIYAACEESADQPNVRAAGVRSADSLRMNGTSVAAPVFARRLYNWMMTPRKRPAKGGLAGAIEGVIKAESKGRDLVRRGHPDEPGQREPDENATSESLPASSPRTAPA